MTDENDFKEAEALKKIHRMPEPAPRKNKKEKDKEIAIENPSEFAFAVGNALMDKKDHVIVTEKLFKYLVNNDESKYLTYGQPGIKVFIEGTRDSILVEEAMNAEDYHNYITRKRAAERGI